MQGQVDGLQSELGAETRRREEAELHVEEKDAELAGALARLGEYERVMMHIHAHVLNNVYLHILCTDAGIPEAYKIL